MRIALYSPDHVLQGICREIVRDLSAVQWQITIAAYRPDEQILDAEVYIWDLPPDIDISNSRAMLTQAGREAEHIFLVDRDESQALLQLLHGARGRVLLRPVNPVLLRSLMETRMNQLSGNEETPVTVSCHASERDQMLQTVLEMNVRLQEYEQDRSLFIYKILNDLREPLIGFDGYCDLLIERKLGPMTPEQVNAVRSMQQSVKRLFRVSASIQELSGADRSRLTPRILAGDIEACIQRAVHEVQSLADRRRLRIDVQLIEPPGTFWFDQVQIEQLMVNLLDNACRSSHTGAEITIEGSPVFWDRRVANVVEVRAQTDRRRTLESQVPNAYRVEVRDAGKGMAQADLDKLFHDFVSAGELQDGIRLNGLGLATCKQIVNRHGGRMYAESSDGGSRFVFDLPLDRQLAKSTASATEADDRGGLRTVAGQA